VVVVQVAGLGIGAAVAEMTAAQNMLRSLKDHLEEEVVARTADLAVSEARLAEAQEVAHIGSWEWDARTGQVFWSEELYRICGLDSAAVPTPCQLGALVPPDDGAKVGQIVERAIADGQPFDFESRFLIADGRTRVGLTRGRVIRDPDGRTLRLIGTVQDVTEQKQLEVRLQQAQRLEALGLLAGGIAHDFNNLITAMGGYAELVLADLDSGDRRRDDLLEVRKAAERAAALTRRLLTFSRTQSIQLKPVDVNGVVNGLEILLRRTIGEHIELTFSLEPRLQAVQVDPDQLEQVVLNIALNARDAMPDGGELRFTTALVDVDAAWARQHPPMTPGRYVRLGIADTGIGMPPEVQARIFEPLFTTKPAGQGTGFGLATVYAIIKQSGGFIWVSSAVGRGTVFEIYLPALETRAEEALEVARTASPGSGETILVVEDDGAVRRLSRDVLTHAGYMVLDARDGDEALTLTRASPTTVDLVITDVVMPGLTGRELAERLRAAFPRIRVLYTSGYTKTATMTAGIDASAPFLPKPFLPTDLLTKVRDVLGGSVPTNC
jgi:two-component system, cell cycle sensor histidine kinase and response regulator CckA